MTLDNVGMPKNNHSGILQQDDVFYVQIKETEQRLLNLGMSFIANDGVLSHRSQPRGKEEMGSGSKHLHRGVYCPSPVIDIYVSNSKRGRILKRPTLRSHITNRYVYDTAGRLLFIDNYIDDKMISSEYMLYLENATYGVTVDMSGKLFYVSEEIYADERLQSYIYAAYCKDYGGQKNKMICDSMYWERYGYDTIGLLTWDYYYIFRTMKNTLFQRHDRFQFTREDGYLTGYFLINLDETSCKDTCYERITIKRKA